LGGPKKRFWLIKGRNGRIVRKWPVALLFALLGLLVVATFFVYLSRLSDGSGGAHGTGDQPPSQTRRQVAVPSNVTVTVDKGATISWDGTDEVRQWVDRKGMPLRMEFTSSGVKLVLEREA
jgi:hypothetical protein